jgi:putative transposase
MKRKRYPSDLTNAQWAVLEPLIPPARPGGRPRKHPLREIVNAISYIVREGCSWRALPHDFPPWKTVYNYFRAWQDDGTWTTLRHALRTRLRTAKGRHPDPHTAYIDSQSVKTAEGGEARGFDGGKKVQGRKRHILVDSLGLLLAVVVTPASVDDGRAAPAVLADVRPQDYPRLRVVWGDSKYHNHDLADWLRRHQRPYAVEVVRRSPETEGFQLLPKRWVVERTFAWLGRYRRLNKDHERLTTTSAAMIEVSAVHHMLRRLKPPRPKPRFHYQRPRTTAA